MMVLVMLQALYACVSITNKTLLGYCNPFVFASFRMVIASLIVAVYSGYNRQIVAHISWGYWPYYAYLIVCGVFAKYTLTFWALSELSVVKMACLFNCTPFFMAGMSWYVSGQSLSAVQCVGLMLGFLGMVPLFVCTQGGPSNSCWWAFGYSECAVILAIIIECIHLHIKKFLVHERGHSPFGLSLIAHGCGGLLSLATIWIFAFEMPSRADTTFYVRLLFSALIGTVVCNTLYVWLLKKHTATTMTYSDYLHPFFVALLSWILFAQQPPWQLIVSISMTSVGLFCLLQTNKRMWDVS